MERPRGRPRAFDRDTALGAAMELFWRRGFSATSVADLCAAMGINAPSLYAAFGSKEALYEAALARYAALTVPRIWGGLDAQPTARDAIADVLLRAAEALPGDGRPAGCMISLSSVGQEGEARLGALVAEGRREGERLLARRIARAIAEGELPAATDASGIARFYSCVQQGMSILARDGAGAAELRAVAHAALAAWPALVATAEGAPPAPPAPAGR